MVAGRSDEAAQVTNHLLLLEFQSHNESHDWPLEAKGPIEWTRVSARTQDERRTRKHQQQQESRIGRRAQEGDSS